MLKLFWVLAKALGGLGRRIRRLPREAAAALGAHDLGQPAEHRRLWRAVAVVLPIALLAALVLPQLSLVMSPSIDALVVRKAPGPIAKNDYVMFTLHHPIAGPTPVSVTKRVLCVPGERITHIETPSASAPKAFDGHYFCNGVLLGVSLPFSSRGLKLEHMQWSGVIPPGMVYVGSHHPRGFDSRYFGLLPISRLTRMERLL